MQIKDTGVVLLSDKERFEFFASRWHHGRIEMLCERLQTTGWISEGDLDRFVAYFESIASSPLFIFNNREIQSAYKDFNEKAKVLSRFIYDHFEYFKPPVKKGGKSLEIYELYPRQKRSSDFEEREFYYRHYKKLSTLAVAFGRAYYKLIQTGMSALGESGEKEGPSLDGRRLTVEPEKYFDVTLRESQLLQILMSTSRKDTRNSYKYDPVKKKDLVRKLGSPKALERIRERLLKKNPKRVPIFNIEKDYVTTRRKRVPAYRLIVFRLPQQG